MPFPSIRIPTPPCHNKGAVVASRKSLKTPGVIVHDHGAANPVNGEWKFFVSDGSIMQFNLEMITRDPLKVPVYTDPYWVTFGELRARHLAETLALVRRRSSTKLLPTVSDKTLSERVAFEEQNNVASFNFARRELGL